MESALRKSAPRSGSATVIFLHGLGDSGHGWELLQEEAHRRPSLQHVDFVLPHAPVREFSLMPGKARGWFDWPVNASDAFAADLFKMVEYVESLIAEEVKRGVDPSRILVGGFSQGAALTQSLATTYKGHKLGGFVSLSGFLPAQKQLLARRSDVNVKTPFFIAHGTADPVVPFQWSLESVEALRKNFLFTNVEFHPYEGLPHSISPRSLSDLLDFLEKTLSK